MCSRPEIARHLGEGCPHPKENVERTTEAMTQPPPGAPARRSSHHTGVCYVPIWKRRASCGVTWRGSHSASCSGASCTPPPSVPPALTLYISWLRPLYLSLMISCPQRPPASWAARPPQAGHQPRTVTTSTAVQRPRTQVRNAYRLSTTRSSSRMSGHKHALHVRLLI